MGNASLCSFTCEIKHSSFRSAKVVNMKMLEGGSTRISIILETELIDLFKQLAKKQKGRYQSLMRQALWAYVKRSERVSKMEKKNLEKVLEMIVDDFKIAIFRQYGLDNPNAKSQNEDT